MQREKPSRSSPRKRGKTPERTPTPTDQQVRIADLLDRLCKIQDLLYAPIAVLTRREDGRIGKRDRRDLLALLREAQRLSGGPRIKLNKHGIPYRVDPPSPLLP